MLNFSLTCTLHNFCLISQNTCFLIFPIYSSPIICESSCISAEIHLIHLGFPLHNTILASLVSGELQIECCCLHLVPKNRISSRPRAHFADATESRRSSSTTYAVLVHQKYLDLKTFRKWFGRVASSIPRVLHTRTVYGRSRKENWRTSLIFK